MQNEVDVDGRGWRDFALFLVQPFIGVVALGLARAFGDSSGTCPLWVFGGLLLLTDLVHYPAVRRLLFRRWPGGLLQLRLGWAMAGTTAAIHLVGWGPVLAPGLVIATAQFLRSEGSRVWMSAAVWTVVATVGGLLALEQGLVSTYVAGGQVQIVTAFSGLVTLLITRVLGMFASDLERAEASVVLSERRFRSLVQRAADAVAVVDADGVVTYVSPSSESVLGVPVEEIVGADMRLWLHPDDLDTATEAFDRTLASTSDADVQVEVRVRHRDGTYRWLEVRSRNLTDDVAVGGVVANFRDVTDRRRWQERLEFAATHDTLTGLPNRAVFLDEIAGAIPRARPGDALGVLFIDLDGFKHVNDTHGHDAGDRLLVEAASRVAAVLRPGDVLARLGGDEFTVLIRHVVDPGAVLHVVDQMQAALLQPFHVAGAWASVGASVGIVIVEDADEQPETILRNADMAMYRAKKGSARFEVFDDAVRDETVMRTETELALRSALANDELEVWFQPVIALDTDAVVGAEALLRWRHPSRGVLVPADFLPLAESTGLVIPIGEWVLEQALTTAASWPEAMTVSVNMSSQQLVSPGLLDMVRGALARAGVAPPRLCIEVLETYMLNEAGLKAVHALRELGVQVAVDDFGTGYSSLAYLRLLTVDSIKIDRQFVERLGESPTDLAIVTKIVELAHALNIRVVAEGIETVAQHEALRTTGCDQAQGYRWAKPAPASAADLRMIGIPS